MSDYLPQETCIEILKRLDPKTLLRCTAVSKAWYSFITSPYFIAEHLKHALEECQTIKHQKLPIRHCSCDFNNISEECILLHDNDEAEVAKLDPPQDLIDALPQNNYGDFRTVGFANGLLCVAADDLSTNIQTIILWNPSIRKFVSLPRHTIKRSLLSNLALVGFGSHFSNGEYNYKVVRILFPKAKRYNQIRIASIPAAEVFSSRDGKWRRVEQIDIQCRSLNFIGSPALVNGAAHWIVFKPNQDVPGIWPSILSFDFGDELFREMALPDAFSSNFSGNGYLIKLEDCLAAVKYENDENDPSKPAMFSVWVMEEYGVQESWTRLHNFGLVHDMVHAVASRKNDELIMTSRNREFEIYRPQSNLLREFAIFEWPISFPIGDYIESLVLL